MNDDFKKAVFVVKTFYQKNNFTQVQKAYRSKFKNQPIPSICKLKYIVSKFENTGSVARKARKNAELSEKRSATRNQLETLVRDFPNLSVRKAASAAGVSPTLIFTILHDDLHLKPYKLSHWHKLEEHDYEKRVIFAEWFLKLPNNAKFFFICSDEAYFTLTQPINRQNNRIWSETAPFEGIEVPLNDEKVLVWCTFSSGGIYGPYFFETTVKKENYLEMLQTFLRRHCQVLNCKKYYFQQDGATSHTTDMVQN